MPVFCKIPVAALQVLLARRNSRRRCCAKKEFSPARLLSISFTVSLFITMDVMCLTVRVYIIKFNDIRLLPLVFYFPPVFVIYVTR